MDLQVVHKCAVEQVMGGGGGARGPSRLGASCISEALTGGGLSFEEVWSSFLCSQGGSAVAWQRITVGGSIAPGGRGKRGRGQGSGEGSGRAKGALCGHTVARAVMVTCLPSTHTT